MPADIGIAEDLAFRPEQYFLGQTVGNGLLRDPFGRIVRRCTITTQGRRDTTYSALRLDETYAFDDGEVDPLQWVITRANQGRYVLAEARAGTGIVAEFAGGELSFVYHRAPLNSPLKARIALKMGLIAPDVVLKTARISLLGAPLGSLTAIHRKTR